MHFSAIFASAALLATTVLAATPIATPITTQVYTVTSTYTSDYVFYCPSATVFTHKNATYTATTATWLTITNCPCVVTYTSDPYMTVSQAVSTLTSDGVVATVTYPPTVINTQPPVASTTVAPNFPTAARPTSAYSAPGAASSSSKSEDAAPYVTVTAGAALVEMRVGVGALVAVGLAVLAL